MKKVTKATRGKVHLNDKAYIAGLIDGEGCIGVYKFHGKALKEKGWNPRYTAYVAIINTDKEVLKWVQELYGGYLAEKKRYSEKHSQGNVLQIRDENLKVFLKEIIPYLRIKKKQAENVLAYWEMLKAPRPDYGRGKQRLTEEELAKREHFYQVSRSLNRPQRLSEETP